MPMSRKDYVAIANIIKLKGSASSSHIALDQHRRNVLKGVASDLADIFASDNPQFQRGKFLEACGVAQ